jgi:hypothetical protein
MQLRLVTSCIVSCSSDFIMPAARPPAIGIYSSCSILEVILDFKTAPFFRYERPSSKISKGMAIGRHC